MTTKSTADTGQRCYAIFHGKGGWPGESERAKRTFRVGGQYEIVDGDIGRSSTRLIFRGIEGEWNSVLFHYDETIAPLEHSYGKISLPK